MFPKLIVFDFHGCLSLKYKELLKIKEKLENGNWYLSMVKNKIDPYVLMPTLNDVIYFVDVVRFNQKESIFAIASMFEDEDFMYSTLKYCFEYKGKISPFIKRNIISYHEIGNKKKNNKWPLISKIMNRGNLKLDKSEIVLIDDNEKNVSYMTSIGVCSILVEKYFKISDWNKGCYINK